LGDYSWEVVPVGGHDRHSVVLFHSDQRVLMSADNLWENGFGVVFSELEGVDGFRELGRSLDRIESLRATLVIPGHGRPFTDIAQALVLARKRLAYFTERPERHFLHAARVLLKFKLLDLQQTDCSTLVAWAQATPYMNFLQERAFSQTMSTDEIVELLVADLIKANAAERDGGLVQNIN
jgi:glyoxylase-like metal-dependent hydrolase (beta-lactamase superfamily II)